MIQNDGKQLWLDELARNGLEIGKPLSSKILINTAQDRIWEKLSEPGYLKRCHPFCASTEVEKWPGVGSRDTITYYSGRTYRRYFVAWLDGIGYDIELGLPPDQTCRVLWRIDPQSGTHCDFSIDVVPYLKTELPEAKKSAYQARLFGADLQHYLDCVVQGVEYWVRTGQDVQKNQFGSNPLYSD